MGLGKTYSTKYLLDSNNNSGVAGQVLSTTSTGIDWVDANTVPGAGLWLESGNDIYNSNSGNVAIGVTTTGAKLQIDKANANSSVIISRSGTNIGASTGVGSITFPSHYNSSYTDYAAIQAYSNNLSSVRGSLDLKVKSTSGTLLTGLTVYGTSSGVNVGIGVTEPSNPLHVFKNATIGPITSPTVANAGLRIQDNGASLYIDGNSLATDSAGYLTTINNSHFDIGTNSTSRIHITGGGNVGIGIIPDTKLEVSSSGAHGVLISKDTGTPSNSGRLFFETDTVSEGFSFLNSNGLMTIRSQAEAGATSGNVRVTIDGSGNVGIGTTSPNSKLELGPNGSLGANITNKNVILNIDGGYGTTGTPSSGQYKVIGFTGTTKDVTDITGQTSGEVLKNFYLGMIGGDYFNVNRFSFWQGGDERLTIQGYGTNAGNIGINSTNPTAKLHIAKTTTWGEMSNPIINIQNNGTGGNINTAHNMGSITWKSGTVSTAEIKAVRNTPASGDNVELRFSTSDAGVQGERMTIENDGVVLINNSLGINVTSVSTGYKLDIGGGDIYARQAVAKISLGQFGSQGDAHFGASGIGSPTVGSQDYGFYSAHNAYRTSTGAWKHSRTSTIGAVRILGGGGGSSGNAGFSFDYSANNGTSDITWTNLMHLSTGGNLQLPEYGAGVLVSDGNGTITSGGDIDIDAEVIINDNLVNYEFTALDNVAVQYWLLCFNSGANDVNGTLWGDRSSGHHQAMNLDIVVSAKSASMQTGMLTTKQVLESNEKYTLVTLTYNSNNYIAIKYEGHPYVITGNGYFSGLLKSTIGSNFLLAVNGASVSNVANFSNSNTKATIQAAKVGIGKLADPEAQLHVLGNVIFDSYSTTDPDSTSRTAYPAAQMFTHYDEDNGVSIIGGEGNWTGCGLTIGEETIASSNFKFIRGVSDSNGGANAAEEFWVKGDGKAYFSSNVGIGPSTTSPTHKLEVRDGTISGEIAKFSAIGATVVIESSTAGNAKLFLKPSTTGLKRAEFRVTNANDYGFLWTADTSPGGTAYMELEASSTGGGDLTVKGDVIAYGSPSDKKYKENIKPIESALDKAMKLQGVTFDWKDSESILEIKEDIGFIAQDVKEVLPELVRENKKGNLSLRYQGITPILLEAIKELKAEIEELKLNNCNCNK